jgi:hypothetical protein
MLEAGGLQLRELPHLLAGSFDDGRSSKFCTNRHFCYGGKSLLCTDRFINRRAGKKVRTCLWLTNLWVPFRDAIGTSRQFVALQNLVVIGGIAGIRAGRSRQRDLKT